MKRKETRQSLLPLLKYENTADAIFQHIEQKKLSLCPFENSYPRSKSTMEIVNISRLSRNRRVTEPEVYLSSQNFSMPVLTKFDSKLSIFPGVKMALPNIKVMKTPKIQKKCKFIASPNHNISILRTNY